jgi:hypothetical protein
MRSNTLVVFDLTEKRWLGKSWAAYAATFACSEGITSWDELQQIVLDRGPGMDLQVWGHGSPGRPYVGREAADPSWGVWGDFNSVWFRSCSVANGAIGHSFMTEIAEQTNVAAHLGIIGTWAMHSRLVALQRGATPWWSASDVHPRENSAPWVPRSVTAVRRSLPDWAYKP